MHNVTFWTDTVLKFLVLLSSLCLTLPFAITEY